MPRLAVAHTRLLADERSQRAQAEALRDTASALASTLSLEEVLDRILTEVSQVVPHDAANVMLVEGSTARIVGGKGYAPHGLATTILSVQAPITGTNHLRHMAETGRPLAIPDTRAHSRLARHPRDPLDPFLRGGADPGWEGRSWAT